MDEVPLIIYKMILKSFPHVYVVNRQKIIKHIFLYSSQGFE